MAVPALRAPVQAAESATPPPVAAPPKPKPVCHGTGCTVRPLVQWRRRLTAIELATELAAEQARRAERYTLRDTQQPEPDFGLMPTAADYTRAVYACGSHAISMDAAPMVHAADCSGPNSPALPACDCTPEPSTPTPLPVQELPDHWVTAMPKES